MDNEKCRWGTVYRWDGKYWETGCGNRIDLWTFTPYELGMKFCAFCGSELEQGQ